MSFYAYRSNASLGTSQFLVMGIPLDASVATTQNIAQLIPNPAIGGPAFTEPFVATWIRFRGLTSDLDATTIAALGWADTNINPTINLITTIALGEVLNSSGGVVSVPADNNAHIGLPGQYLNITFDGTLTDNGTLVVDVEGYFIY